MNTPIALSAKFSAPILSDTLNREDLLRYLHGTDESIIWFTAPGGSGKTTLAADWLRNSGASSVWLRLDESDSAVGTFFHHLTLAAQHAFPTLKHEFAQFTLANSLDPATFLRNFLQSFSALPNASEFVLVLDDYHELMVSSAVHNLLSQAFEDLPNNVRILILSRHSAPQNYITIKAHNQLKQLDWDDIKFSSAEVGALLFKAIPATLPTSVLEAIHHNVDGWAAGVRLISLLLEEQTSLSFDSIDEHYLTDILQEKSFDYFAQEVMTNILQMHQDFLLRTSCFPFFTAAMADAVTGKTNSEVVLQSLVKRNSFIETHSYDQTTYSYHPLFKQFLQNRLVQTHSPSEVQYFTKQAAQQLLEISAFEEATDLLLHSNAYEDAKNVIKEHSQMLVYQGRGQQLESWLNQLPQMSVDNDPDLLSILGSSLLLSATDRACTILRSAIDGYERQNRTEQAIQTYGSYLEALAIAGKDYHLLEDCLEHLETLITTDPYALAPTAEKIASIVLFSTAFATLKHPLQKRWRTYAERALSECKDPVRLLKSCNNMMIYYRFSGEDRHTYHLLNTLQPIRQEVAHIPLLKLQTQLIDAFHCGYVCSAGERAEQLCRESIEEGLTNGIRLYEFWFRYILVLTLLRDHNFSSAEQEINQLMRRYTEMPDIRKSDIHTLSGLCALYKQDLHQAKHELIQARNMYYAAGALYPTHWSSIILAQTYHELGDEDAFRSILDSCDADWLGSSYLEYQALCVEAWREHNKTPNEIHKLKAAFALAHKQDFIFIPLVGKKVLSQLCQRALLYGVEHDYVHKIITEHNLSPEEDNLSSHLWPFKIKIYTLQPFTVKQYHTAKEHTVTLQQKPLELLKFLIANGGYDISVDRICDTLWPESDGDAAYKSFKTTLYRLRKSLGGDQYVITNHSTLSLSEECWVDAFSLWNPPKIVTQQTLGQAQQIIELYQTQFLAEDQNEFWTSVPRERIQRHFKTLTSHLVEFLLSEQRIDDAITYLEHALSTDVAEEDYYRDLMRCYAQNGRVDRVEVIYQRCCDTLDTLLNSQPSTQFTTLYHTLRQST